MKQTTADLFRGIFAVLAPPPNVTLSQWADRYRVLSSESSASPGQWHTERVPHMREIMDAISDPNVPKVVCMLASQTAKTDACICNTIGYYIHFDPSPIMVLQPTIQMAEAFSKDRLTPMLRDSPVLRDKVNDRSRNSGNTILQKLFPGGHVTMTGANSPSSLASRPIRILLMDEVDRFPATAGNEGDPMLLAGKRTAAFWNSKEVITSSPTIKGLSRIEVEYEHSTKEVWNVPCPECGELQPLEWARVVFDKADPDKVSHTCRKCGVVADEYAWKEHFTEGKYVADCPGRKVRGFYVNSLASYFVEWGEIVRKFLKANEQKKRGNVELLKVWTNTEMAQLWEEEGEQVEENDLFKRRENYSCEVPPGVMFLTAGVDTQDDRFEVEVVGWGEGKESWGIQYQVIRGDMKQEQVWKDLDAFLLQTWTRADGAKLPIGCACIDSGGHHATQVYRFTKARYNRHIYAIKGKGGADVPYYNKPTQNNREKAYLWTIGVDTGKSLLLDRLKVEEPGPGYCHFPREDGRGYDETYFKGLTAERQVMSYKKGKPVFVWQLKDPGYKRNEPLDVRNYATVALEIANPRLTRHTDPPAAPPRKRGRGRRSKGSV